MVQAFRHDATLSIAVWFQRGEANLLIQNTKALSLFETGPLEGPDVVRSWHLPDRKLFVVNAEESLASLSPSHRCIDEFPSPLSF